MKLRDYQREAVDSLYSFFDRYPKDVDRNPVIAMPTGTGKAVVIGGFVHETMVAWPSQRMLMATHSKELVGQNADKLETMWPQAPLGIYSAGLKQKESNMPITFGNIQSIAAALKRDPTAFGWIDLMIVDECHMVSPSENASYKFVIRVLREINPRMRVIGLSATPYRLGLGHITDGGVFSDLSFDVTGMRAFNRFLDEGYLSPPIPMSTDTKIDVSGVAVRGGEFVPGALDENLTEEILWAAVQESVGRSLDRNHLLYFVPGVEKVDLVVKMLNALGVKAAGVHSKMKDKSERDENIANFLNGSIRALVNADILTTGFDFPALDCIVLLRATNSPALHVQIVGRGTRPLYYDPLIGHNGGPAFDLNTVEGRHLAIKSGPKQNCLVLDFAGNTMRLGPINDPRMPRKKGDKPGSMPAKQCDACGAINHISARNCVLCGEEFTFEEKITDRASTAALIAVEEPPEVVTFNVDRVTFAPHKKMGSFPTLRVSYFCGVRRFTEWVCLEHPGPVRNLAHKWWRQRTDLPVPETVEEARQLVDKLTTPARIRVWVNRKYPEILAAEFDEEEVA